MFDLDRKITDVELFYYVAKELDKYWWKLIGIDEEKYTNLRLAPNVTYFEDFVLDSAFLAVTNKTTGEIIHSRDEELVNVQQYNVKRKYIADRYIALIIRESGVEGLVNV